MSLGPRPLAASLSRATGPLFRRRGLADGAIVMDWPAIVGGAIAALTAPERIVYPPRRREGGTLKLRVASSGLALELQHLQPQVIERINAHFGFAAVARLHIIHGPVPRRQSRTTVAARSLTDAEERSLAGSLSPIDDPEVSQVLESLGRSILGRTPAR